MSRTAILAPVVALLAAACVPLEEARDVSGNFDVEYVDNLRVFIDDTLVAEVASGEDVSFEWDGETLQVSTLCGDAGTECPGETFWGEVAVEQPWGADNKLLNFVNLDPDRGTPGQRLGGLLEDDGTYAMLAGLGLSANEACAVLGVGVVSGAFTGDAAEMVDGVIAHGWAAGCTFDGVTIGGELRIETDFTATRTGPFDVSSVTAEPAIDAEGEPI